MKRPTCLMLFWILLLGLAVPVTGQQGEEEFESLFNRKDLTGWRGYQQSSVPDSWTVEDGSIRGAGHGPDLITEKKYGNFELRFEWKIAPGGNSGVIYRASEDEPQSYQTGPEYQVLDDKQREDDRINPLTSAASLYGLYGTTEKTVRAAGEWNEAKIIARNSHLEHWLNGRLVVECEIGSDDWQQKVAASKFHDWKKFGTITSGHIAIQSHGSPVWYRNLRIRTLAPNE